MRKVKSRTCSSKAYGTAGACLMTGSIVALACPPIAIVSLMGAAIAALFSHAVTTHQDAKVLDQLVEPEIESTAQTWLKFRPPRAKGVTISLGSTLLDGSYATRTNRYELG